MENQTLTINIDSDNYNPVYLKYSQYNEIAFQIVFGGSSSGKSVSLADRAITDTLQGRNYLICRKVANTIRMSCFNEVVKSIHKFNVYKYFNINKSDMVITAKTNSMQILFCGLDDVEKIKSIVPVKGVITDIWVEEATETTRDDIKQLKKRLRGLSKFKKRMTLSFNPILKTHWIYLEHFKGFWVEGQNYIETDKISILKTTYKDNNFLEEEDKKALEDETDRYYHDVYTLGNWGILGHVIFKNWKIKSFDETTFDNYKNGLDWGYVHPFALARVHYDKERNKLYICDEICQTELLNKDSAKLVKEIIEDELVTCDSAEPKSIQEYRQLGVNALAAQKGKGSVEYGIKFLQALEIIVHPRCQSFINTIQVYQWKEDKDGNALPVPLDKDDDLIDATRYAMERDSFANPIPEPPKTMDDLKTLDMFSSEYEDIEDKLQVIYEDGEPRENLEERSEPVTGF